MAFERGAHDHAAGLLEPLACCRELTNEGLPVPQRRGCRNLGVGAGCTWLARAAGLSRYLFNS